MIELESILRHYHQTFGVAPGLVARAPGRVNLIGEHTDYNEGLVLPFAIDRAVVVAAGPGTDGLVRVHSASYGQTVAFPCAVSEPADEDTWQNYVRGVVSGLHRRRVTVGATNLCIGGDLPLGSGLSSSAALCVATTLALTELGGVKLEALPIVEVVREAERDFGGTPCGIMDPYVSLLGRAGHALLLDCRNAEHEHVPLNPPDLEFLAVPSGVRHELAQSAYATRVRECREAVASLREVEPEIRSLRDATLEALNRHRSTLGPTLERRARHVVSENSRVADVVHALRKGDYESIGQMVDASHASLRDQYEVSCDGIETLLNLLREEESVLGARMIGGGFGGTVLALARSGAADRLSRKLRQQYLSPADDTTRVHVVRPMEGATVHHV